MKSAFWKLVLYGAGTILSLASVCFLRCYNSSSWGGPTQPFLLAFFMLLFPAFTYLDYFNWLSFGSHLTEGECKGNRYQAAHQWISHRLKHVCQGRGEESKNPALSPLFSSTCPSSLIWTMFSFCSRSGKLTAKITCLGLQGTSAVLPKCFKGMFLLLRDFSGSQWSGIFHSQELNRCSGDGTVYT